MTRKKRKKYNRYEKIIFIFFIVVAFSYQNYSQQPKINFEHFSIDNGATEPIVNWITQDRDGYLWFSCNDVNFRYDGYSFVSYKHDPKDTIGDNISFTVPYEDKEGNFWIGTTKGLEKLDRATGNFTHYIPNPSDSISNKSNCVLSICEDKNGTLWIGTKNGLYKFDRTTLLFKRLFHDSTVSGSVYNDEIREIYKDKQGEMWFGTAGGLDKLDYKKGTFIHYWSDPEIRIRTVDNSSKYWVNDVCEDNDRTIWLATNWGIVEYNRKSGTFNNYQPHPETRAIDIPNHIDILNDNYIYSLCNGDKDILWVGSYTGLYGFDKKSKTFKYRYTHENDKPGSISNNTVVSLFAEQSETIWAGTLNGINKFNPVKAIHQVPFPDGYFHYMMAVKNVLYIRMSNGWYQLDEKSDKFYPHIFGKDKLYWKEDSGNSWFRDKKGNLYRKDIHGNITYFYTPSGEKFNAPVASFLEGSKNIWVGTIQGYGLYVLDTTKQIISEFKKNKGHIRIIYEDSFGLVWLVRPWQNLLCYDQEKDTVREFISDPGIPGSISGQNVTKIIEDKKRRLWFATDKGLNRYDHLTDKFIYYPDNTDLSDEYIILMLEDEQGCLWLGKSTGMIKFNPDENLFQHFTIPSGFKLAEAVMRATKTANGEMYFGGENGLIHFHPDNLKINSFIPPIVITSFKKFDKPSPVKKEIHLLYDENFISFEFAALSYINNEKNRYAYMMEGLDKDWIYSGTRRYASYPNLNPGRYVFKVKGSNNDGVWNEEGTSVLIFISPPWWKTVWAYIPYSIILVSLIYITWRLQIKRIRIRHEYEMSRFEAEKLQELDELKSKFFANISHEFRTPLTMIIGPVKQIIERIKDEKTRDELKVVRRNASNLLGLVNQLLDISKLEFGKMKLQAIPQNIIPLLKALVFSFSSYAERKKITLQFNSLDEEIVVYLDKDKIEKVVNNILSNALKFTPEGGEVVVTVKTTSTNNILSTTLDDLSLKKRGSSTNEYVQISISDTGIGIQNEKIPKIFDRFYQVDGSRKREHEGTGIGLALAKELIELHKGVIEVESEEGKGTTFIISLPIGKKHLSPEEIDEQPYDGKVSALEAEEETLYDESTVIPDFDIVSGNGKQILLIVEDNADVRRYIKDNLIEDYNILEATNGEEGLNQAVEHIPDLIISDVMMPKMDGFELCNKVKTDERTSHIPVIMLTAKASERDKIGGYETGADDYIMKPFDMLGLNARIKNLIEQRKRIHEHFRKKGLIELEMSEIKSTDKRFLQKAFEIINKNMADPGFGLEKLSELLSTSRSVLYRKIIAITGESPGELIRQIRLKKASQLIEQKFGNISEISLEVGFSNPSQFTRSFRKLFGVSPSEYHQNHKNTSR